MRNTSSPIPIDTDSTTSQSFAMGGLQNMRKKLMFRMALSMLVLSILLLPFALVALRQGQYVPLILSILVAAVTTHSMIALKTGNIRRSVLPETFGLVLMGGLLTLADPDLVDPGLAILVLVPVHHLLTNGKISNASASAVLSFLAAFAGLCTAGWVPGLLSDASMIRLTGLGYFLPLMASHLFSAYRLSRMRQHRERAHSLAVRQLADRMGDGYVRFSVTGSVQYVSSGVLELLGARAFELAGTGLLERVHVLDRPIFLKAVSDNAHAESGANMVKTLEVRLRSDTAGEKEKGEKSDFIWVEMFFSPVREVNPADRAIEIVALLRNVTNRKDREFELIKARKAAEEASSIKSGFLATIGHELRTPLNAIVGFSEMMTNGIGGEMQPAHLEYAKLIHQSGHHLLDVVNMLLDMSKIEAGKFELHVTGFEPANLVRPCKQMMDSAASEKNVRIVTDIAGNLPTVHGDERACRQILINLLSNAIKFSHPGGEITVGARRQGGYLVLSVTDTGIGMSRESAQRVGEAFYQAHNGLSRQYEGTGLGLSIVKGLVELHQGKLKIDSELGRGTTISVMLPLKGPRAVPAETPNVTRLAPSANTSSATACYEPDPQQVVQERKQHEAVREPSYDPRQEQKSAVQ